MSHVHTLTQLRAGQLAGATRLALREGLTEFPPEIFALADSLEILDLSGNALTALPADLPRLRRLRVLFCSDNQFTELPAVLGQCEALEMVGFKANRIRILPAAALPPHLRWLILTDNQLETLPDELGACAHLQKLMLAGNHLRALPRTLAACTRLELLRISANELPALPTWLLSLPRLAWLAYAGNPFAEAAEAAARAQSGLPGIAWADLTLGPLLGEGASGVIYQAEWRPGGGQSAEAVAVAVKLFKGTLTSDGRPQSELAACLGAGQHANLIPVRGVLRDHPAGAEGLVLGLVGPEYRNLAGPPTLASCTRDAYAPGTTFTLATARRLARGVVAAAAHLHERGVLHGDLYAHNLLVGPGGEVLLGDFGAASFFDSADAALAAGLQRLETRAFGLLLEELLAHADAASVAADAPGWRALRTLQRRCTQPLAAARPLLAELEPALAAN